MTKFELLIFSSEDCKPCQLYIPTVKQVCEKMQINCKIIKRESDKDLFEYYQVLSVPTTLLLANNKAVWSTPGAMNYVRLMDKLIELKETYYF
jgi:thioredoxin-related protein